MAHLGKWFGFGRDDRFDAGVRAYESGDFQAAADEFRLAAHSRADLALRHRAKSYLAGALGRLGKAALAQNDQTAALDHLSEAVVLRPRYADLHMALAMVHEALGEYGKRNEEVEAALRINPKYGVAILYQASMMMMSGDHANGLARAVQAVAMDRRLETAVFREAIALADSGDWETAALKLRQVRPEGQDDPDFLSMRGDRMMAESRFQDAAECYRNALELSPGYADLHLRYSQALLELDQVENAVEELNQATTLNPDYAEAHAVLGVALRRSGKEQEALESFRRALDIDPDQVIASMEIRRRR
ncbi:MAG: tetratricopeptide repeat protein [Chthonomonadaceae bacterium]|nr:tetratricopeptide repeat protein [Chthonomonadaceae bacterium]